MSVLVTLIPLFLLLLPLAVAIVRHYASPGTSLPVRLLVIMAFWLGFSGIVLLPIDLSLTTTTDDLSAASNSNGYQSQQESDEKDGDAGQVQRYTDNNPNANSGGGVLRYLEDAANSNNYAPPEPNATYMPWLVTYWVTFTLAWLILPHIRKALLSGHFTPFTRIRDAVQTSLRMYMILSGLLFGAIVFLAIHLRSWHVIPILMALSNTYGLLLVTLLLGYGLVDLPRKMWRMANPHDELRRTQILANAADEALFDAVWELQDCEDEIDVAVNRVNLVRQDPCGASMTPEVQAVEAERDGRMTYDQCLTELVRRRNMTANLGAALQSRRTKKAGVNNSGGISLSVAPPRCTKSAPGSPTRTGTTTGGGHAYSPPLGRSSSTLSPAHGSSNGADNNNTNGTAKNGEQYCLPSIEELARLNARLKLSQARLVSAEQNWTEIVERSKLYAARVHGDYSHYSPPSWNDAGGAAGGTNDDFIKQPVPPMAAAAPPPTAGEPSPSTSSSSWGYVPLLDNVNRHFSSVSCSLRYLWITRLVSPVSRFVALLFGMLSVLVLWSETTMALPWNLSPFAWFLNMLDGNDDNNNDNNNEYNAVNTNNDDPLDEKGIAFAIAALIPLVYMSTCVYSSLFKISFFGPYCLRGYKQSHGVALIFNAQYLIRMQFPLGYNYLLMLKYDTSAEHTNCAFSRVMAGMSTVPFFGTSFSVYAPMCILALCCFTLCDGYPRVLGMLGLEHEDAILLGDGETLDRQVNEGILLLRRHEERAAAAASTVNGSGNGVVGGVGGGISPTSVTGLGEVGRRSDVQMTSTIADARRGGVSSMDGNSSSQRWYGVV